MSRPSHPSYHQGTYIGQMRLGFLTFLFIFDLHDSSIVGVGLLDPLASGKGEGRASRRARPLFLKCVLSCVSHRDEFLLKQIGFPNSCVSSIFSLVTPAMLSFF